MMRSVTKCPALHRALGAAVAAGIAGILVVPAEALAQARGVVERNLPPAVTGGGGLQQGPLSVPGADDTPLGVNLSGVRLIGLTGKVSARPPRGITVTGIEGLAPEQLDATLRPFLGRPLSRRLVADIQAAMAKAYRGAGRPFVSVTAPPQDISSGVLQIQVIPFRLGGISTRGADADDGAIPAKLRANRGEFIEAPRLAEDLDWLNRYPYRRINGVFEPGSRPGDSDLTLEITRQKPWQVFAGWSNTGTPQTDTNRYFAGFGAGLEALNDTAVSYQLTGSANFWSEPSRINLKNGGWPSYLSHAGRVVIPTFARQSIELAPSFVATSQMSAGNVLKFHNTTFELPIIYRSALSNAAVGLAGWGEVYGGVSPKWTQRNTLFQGIEVASGSAGVLDLILGWANQFQAVGTTAVDLRLVANPGGVVGGNDSATWSLYTNGRVSDAQYVYGTGSIDQSTPLAALVPGLEGFTLRNTLTVQIAGQALPDTEQLAIGGYYAARGYTLSDGSVDAGFALRNELRLPAFPVLSRPGGPDWLKGVGDAASPYLFLDVAHGHNYGLTGALAALNADTTLMGLGAGLDYVLARNVQAGVVAGVALTDGPVTEAGDVTVQGRVVITY